MTSDLRLSDLYAHIQIDKSQALCENVRAHSFQSHVRFINESENELISTQKVLENCDHGQMSNIKQAELIYLLIYQQNTWSSFRGLHPGFSKWMVKWLIPRCAIK